MDGFGKSRLTGIRSPDLTSRSVSLYRLSYPGPLASQSEVIVLYNTGGIFNVLLRDVG